MFAVPVAAFGAIYCATLTADAQWPHYFGLGGLFGDTILGALVNILPLGPAFGIKLMSLVMGGLFAVSMLLVTGFTLPEVKAVRNFLITGLIMTYNQVLGAAQMGASGSARGAAMGARFGARVLAERQAQRGAARAEADLQRPQPLRGAAAPTMAAMRAPGRVVRAEAYAPEPHDTLPEWGQVAPLRADTRYPEPLSELAAYAPPRERGGLFSLVPQAFRRAIEPESELIEPQLSDDAMMLTDVPDDDRIKSRISDAIRQRARGGVPQATLSTNPVTAAVQRREGGMLARLRGPQPLIADTARRMEPPLMAAQMAPPMVPQMVPAPAQVAAPIAAYGVADDMGQAEDDYAIAADWDAEPVPMAAPAPAPAPSLPSFESRRPVVQQTARKATAPSRQAMAEAQPRLRFDDPAADYELPPLSLLTNPLRRATPCLVQRSVGRKRADAGICAG